MFDEITALMKNRDNMHAFCMDVFGIYYLQQLQLQP